MRWRRSAGKCRRRLAMRTGRTDQKVRATNLSHSAYSGAEAGFGIALTHANGCLSIA